RKPSCPPRFLPLRRRKLAVFLARLQLLDARLQRGVLRERLFQLMLHPGIRGFEFGDALVCAHVLMSSCPHAAPAAQVRLNCHPPSSDNYPNALRSVSSPAGAGEAHGSRDALVSLERGSQGRRAPARRERDACPVAIGHEPCVAGKACSDTVTAHRFPESK